MGPTLVACFQGCIHAVVKVIRWADSETLLPSVRVIRQVGILVGLCRARETVIHFIDEFDRFPPSLVAFTWLHIIVIPGIREGVPRGGAAISIWAGAGYLTVQHQGT